jgi:hypothetical protein
MLGMSNTKSVSQMFVHPDITTSVIHISINLLRGYAILSENIIQIQLINESDASWAYK